VLNIERSDNITTISMAHGKVNVMDLELCRAVAQAMRQETDAGGIILTGEGPAFSAGVDLYRLIEGGEDYVGEFLGALVDMFMSVFTWPGPVVAAINGHAIAGGCVIAACCDRRIMSAVKGRIGIPELHVGVPFPVEALEIMRFVLPARHLAEVVYTGGTWLPEQALSRGLVDSVCESAALLPAADTAVRHMASVPRRVFAGTKQQLHQPVMNAIESMSSFNTKVNEHWKEPGTRAVIKAYLDRMMRKS